EVDQRSGWRYTRLPSQSWVPSKERDPIRNVHQHSEQVARHAAHDRQQHDLSKPRTGAAPATGDASCYSNPTDREHLIWHPWADTAADDRRDQQRQCASQEAERGAEDKPGAEHEEEDRIEAADADDYGEPERGVYGRDCSKE